MTRRLLFLTSTMTLALALAACGTTQGTTEPASGGSGNSPLGQVAGRTFLSTAITENGKPKALASDGPIRISFSTTDSISVQAGCNTMSAQVSLSGGRLTLKSPLAATEMACAEELMDQDAWLARLLMAGGTFVARDDGMTLTLGTTTLELSDEEAVTPRKPVVGTVWRLSTIADADVASSVPDQVDATIRFDAKTSRVLISDGCNTGSGAAALSPDLTGSSGAGTATLGPIALTRMACTDDATKTVSAAFAAVLDGTVDVRVHPGGLTVTKGDRSLGFTAVD